MANQTEKSILAQMLTKLRKAHGLTQEQVAKILKIKRSTYAYYERNIIPTPEIISKLALIFNVTVHELMYGVIDPLTYPKPPLRDPENTTEHFGSLTEEERMHLANLRLLPENLKDKIYRETDELSNKSLEG